MKSFIQASATTLPEGEDVLADEATGAHVSPIPAGAW